MLKTRISLDPALKSGYKPARVLLPPFFFFFSKIVSLARVFFHAVGFGMHCRDSDKRRAVAATTIPSLMVGCFIMPVVSSFIIIIFLFCRFRVHCCMLQV